jgi:NTE family protein
VLHGIPGFFTPRLFSMFPWGGAVAPEQASYYDTTPLAATLAELIDFDYLNGVGGMRLTMTAVDVRTGELDHFDSLRGRLTPDHVRASGALPPGFAPVAVGDKLYWDGGLYSNTPLEAVLDELPAGDTLCFLVDLWNGSGPPPTTLEEVRVRAKDVTFASRSQRHIADYQQVHELQHKLRELYARLPEDARSEDDRAALAALGCDTTLHIVRLPYAGRDWMMAAKDLNFSRGSLAWRWDQGYRDAMRALGHAGWLLQVEEDTAVVVHELPPR